MSKLSSILKKNIELLIGNYDLNQDLFLPFDKKIIDFFDELSKTILSKKFKENPEITSFGFWCRKNNLLSYFHEFNSKNFRVGRGISFHITPSNVPLNFCYSMAFGLLSGNQCYIKISNKNFLEVDIVIRIIKKILNKKKFHFLKSVIKIFKTKGDENKIMEYFSSISDVRLIWGGNNTVNYFKKLPTKVNNQDIIFRDRYSICIINSDKILNLKKDEFKRLLDNFYIDTMLYDQNACTAPHIIYWTGKNLSKSRKKFWSYFSDIVNRKYDQDLFQAYDKYNLINKFLINEKDAVKVEVHNRLIYTIQLKNISQNIHSFRGRWGVFIEVYSKSLDDLKKIINTDLQTITYFGIEKDTFNQYFKTQKPKGIDRIVPIGQSLNMSLKWDGYDLMKILTRYVEIK